ncbi:MAG: preprotein translocase subunit YajC [Parachlamydiales bacterium]|nr:preprotein translocase subunit YajC [Parachlamydiales bacterium]
MKKYLTLSLPMLFMSGALFADTTDGTVTGRGNDMWSTLVMIGVALMFFYFILWRPEQKRRKAMEAQRSSLKKGDRVTAMGIVGTIAKVTPEGNTLILRMYDGSQIEVLKAAISDVKSGTDSTDVEVEVTPSK